MNTAYSSTRFDKLTMIGVNNTSGTHVRAGVGGWDGSGGQDESGSFYFFNYYIYGGNF